MDDSHENNASKKTSKTKVQSVTESKFDFRVWKSSSGEHQIEGKFSHIIANQTVVIVTKNDKEIKVPLSKLGADEIYEAVRCELSRRGEDVNSPFKENANE